MQGVLGSFWATHYLNTHSFLSHGSSFFPVMVLCQDAILYFVSPIGLSVEILSLSCSIKERSWQHWALCAYEYSDCRAL